MTAGVRLSAGTVKKDGCSRISEAADTNPKPGGRNDVFWCKKFVTAVFGVMVALNMAGETKMELFFQMPMSMRITADAARK